MGIESIFRKSTEHNGRVIVGGLEVREAMRQYAVELQSAVSVIAVLEGLLSAPPINRDPSKHSSVTLQPMGDYHSQWSIRVVFDNATKQPIGAELLPVEGASDGK